ncbi:hypothetical protein CORC01_10817 [Colletotrichum orchidophilum]|uniref:Uncharacterized protein n=1 Tax=Colletotrichum orchidophilum TaxID=1209926 RepID=A0A1G4AXM8_9PEZI|nr:uncharacterized protein CORC01_10817 [Colletotrichum orchidophilum]OHE93918.1 hypothetical protein CORC01_10817 [Colletotrichum orchidophilum]
MDSMWTNLLRQDERCCLAICLAVNCPHKGLTDDTWYPPLKRVREDMNSTAGDRFIAYIISCLSSDESDDGPSDNRTNLLFEFDKALNFDFGNMPIAIKVLEQVLMFSARIWEIDAPEDTVHPGILLATFDLCDDSVKYAQHVLLLFQMSPADPAELLDTLSDDELESAGHSMCDVDEDLFNDEDDEPSRSDIESGEGSDLSYPGRLDDEYGGAESDFVEGSDVSEPTCPGIHQTTRECSTYNALCSLLSEESSTFATITDATHW